MTEPTDTRKSSWDRLLQHRASQLAALWGKRIGYRVFRLSGELIAIAFTLGIAWFYIMSVLLTQQSLDLKPLSPWAKQGFTKAFAGNDADIADMRLRWLPD